MIQQKPVQIINELHTRNAQLFTPKIQVEYRSIKSYICKTIYHSPMVIITDRSVVTSEVYPFNRRALVLYRDFGDHRRADN